MYEQNKTTLRSDADIQDVVTIVDGLIDVSKYLNSKIQLQFLIYLYF